MVCSNLDYCSSVWNPHQNEQIRKIEMIPKTAAWYTTNRYRNTSSVSTMLEHLQWESLESRRSKIHLTFLYKIVNDLVDTPADEYLTKGASRTRSAHTKKYGHYRTPTDSLKLSSPSGLFHYRILFQHQLLGPLLWNLSLFLIKYIYNFSVLLSLSYAANPHAILVKWDGSMYDVDRCMICVDDQ